MLREFVTSGRVVELVIVFMAFEALAFVLYHWRTRRGPAPADIIPTLLAGLCLLLALRAALTGASWQWIPVLLVASLGAHLADLGRRWQT